MSTAPARVPTASIEIASRRIRVHQNQIPVCIAFSTKLVTALTSGVTLMLYEVPNAVGTLLPIDGPATGGPLQGDLTTVVPVIGVGCSVTK